MSRNSSPNESKGSRNYENLSQLSSISITNDPFKTGNKQFYNMQRPQIYNKFESQYMMEQITEDEDNEYATDLQKFVQEEESKHQNHLISSSSFKQMARTSYAISN